VAPFRRGRLITRAVFDLKANEGLNTHRKLEVVQALPKENVPMQPTEAGRLLVGDAEVALGRLATAEQQLAELAGYGASRAPTTFPPAHARARVIYAHASYRGASVPPPPRAPSFRVSTMRAWEL
jgi:hypothetical protein